MTISVDTALNCKLDYKNTFLNNWYLLQKRALSERIPVISIKNAYFLRTVLQQYSPKYMLEIGSAVGVSSAWIGNILYDWGGQLDTIDISLINYQQTKINLNHL
jgi:predicted O-methyltransferase YrrM